MTRTTNDYDWQPRRPIAFRELTIYVPSDPDRANWQKTGVDASTFQVRLVHRGPNPGVAKYLPKEISGGRGVADQDTATSEGTKLVS